MKLGVIADDFTGASDIAGFLVEGGMRTAMYNGVPSARPELEFDALVVCLKIRSCPVPQAVDESVQALKFLRSLGCDKFYYKYCSTFDSTHEGNIGPVVDALMDELEVPQTIICPSLPVNGRTVCHGYLFVNHDMLSDSSMRYHPITPMENSKLCRLMEGQFRGTTGHVYYPSISAGSDQVRRELRDLQEAGHRYVVVDSLANTDLQIIAEATEEMALVTGGSGLAIGITNVLNRSKGGPTEDGSAFVPRRQKGIVIAGSCSKRTNEQVAAYKNLAPSRYLEEASCLDHPEAYAKELSSWVLAHGTRPYFPMLYATKSPEELKKSKATYGDANVAEAIERVVGLVVADLHDAGVRSYIIGGGETSGVVATTLDVNAYLIGPQIDPGVSWLKALDSSLQFTYKSGNFGAVDFFSKAQDMCAKEDSHA